MYTYVIPGCVYIYIHAYICVHVYIYLHTYILIHTYMDTCLTHKHTDRYTFLFSNPLSRSDWQTRQGLLLNVDCNCWILRAISIPCNRRQKLQCSLVGFVCFSYTQHSHRESTEAHCQRQQGHDMLRVRRTKTAETILQLPNYYSIPPRIACWLRKTATARGFARPMDIQKKLTAFPPEMPLWNWHNCGTKHNRKTRRSVQYNLMEWSCAEYHIFAEYHILEN